MIEMQYEMMKKETIYVCSLELEALLAATHVLLDEEALRQLGGYDRQQVAQWKKNYRFLFESFQAVGKVTAFGILEFLLDSISESFSLEKLEKVILSLPEDERLFRMVPVWAYEWQISQADIAAALVDDQALNHLYDRVSTKETSFLGLSSFLRQNRRYIKEYIALAKEMRSAFSSDFMTSYEEGGQTFKEQIITALETDLPLLVSQQLMGKSFRNRGPYEQYYFIPSLLLPTQCLRLFYEDRTANNRQILFYKLGKKSVSQEQTIAAFKILSDETRYQILRFLAQSQPVKGQDIIRQMKLAPSTISHHMSLLKEAALITEEPVKNAKYYGISKHQIKQLIDILKTDFAIEE